MHFATKRVALAATAIAAFSEIACGGRDPIMLPVPAAGSGTPVMPTPIFRYQLDVYVATVAIPCSGCLVEITSGARAGVSATTTQGRASFFSIPEGGTVTIRTSKANYRPLTTTVVLEREINNARVVLESEGPPIDLSGTRFLEVRADGACEQLPANLRVRTYPVSLVSYGRGLFRAEPLDRVFQRFVMFVLVSADEASFGIEDWINEEAGIVEELPDDNTLRSRLWTNVTPVANAQAISTPIEGTISYCDGSNKCTAVCASKTHQLSLTRR